MSKKKAQKKKICHIGFISFLSCELEVWEEKVFLKFISSLFFAENSSEAELKELLAKNFWFYFY